MYFGSPFRKKSLSKPVVRKLSDMEFWQAESERRKRGKVLFNKALKTFYLQLNGVRHMVKDHSDSKRGKPLPQHWLLFLINSKGSFVCVIPHTGSGIPRPVLHQLWSTGWNEK